jgi:hypothetical protein
VLGGGVMQREELFPKVRGRVAELLNGYLEPPKSWPPRAGFAHAGVLGAIALADASHETRLHAPG